MSQELIPLSNAEGLEGLTTTIVTTTTPYRATAVSPQYRKVNRLFAQPTQWVPGGRPIYRRLPAASETYQVDFYADGEIGYVYIPLGGDQFGAGSLYVKVSEDQRSILIYDGIIVWEVGTTPILKAIVDFEEIGLESGRFLVCYQLIYDDAPQPLPFQVTDYSLGGMDFEVSDSASYVFLSTEKPNPNAWPYPGINAFAPSSANLKWKNYLDIVNRVPQKPAGVEPGLPTPYQPLLCWLEWSSELPWKLDEITLRTPLISNLPDATLSFWEDGDWKEIVTTSVQRDTNGYYYKFDTNYIPQRKWRVSWPNNTKMEIEDITVSGVLYVNSKPSTPRARAQLAIYPTNLIPKDEVLCNLMVINVNDFTIQRNDRGELLTEDIRNIATRDYEPVADWLTEYWDEQLTRNQEKVKTYSPGFMAPPTLLKSSYFDLEEVGLSVSTNTPVYPPNPPGPTEVNLVGATVSMYPITPDLTSLVSAEVSFLSETATPKITDITISVES